MEASELRIGSIIDFDGMKSIVKEIDNQGVVVFIKETDETEWIDLFQFTPITLTEEILLKCGFEKRSDGHFNMFKQSEVDIIICNDFSSWQCDGINFSVNCIKYLHQLQNLYFALIGTELKIEL